MRLHASGGGITTQILTRSGQCLVEKFRRRMLIRMRPLSVQDYTLFLLFSIFGNETILKIPCPACFNETRQTPTVLAECGVG
jgi:hypothetical protein